LIVPGSSFDEDKLHQISYCVCFIFVPPFIADHEDHTFCGVMFPVECKTGLPVDHMIITSVSVRGALGPLTVWVSKEEDKQEEDSLMIGGGTTPSVAATPAAAAASSQSMAPSSTSATAVVTPNAPPQSVARSASARSAARQHLSSSTRSNRSGGRGKSMQISIHPDRWDKVYEKVHRPSMRNFVELPLDIPIKLRPHEMRGLYVHSSLPGDESIVYDNQKAQYTHSDDFLQIRPGLSHLCSRPFGRNTLWGYGSAWRESREFVGRVSYGVVYKLWNPEHHFEFGPAFQESTTTLFMCQRRRESPISWLPDDVLFYILNMCRWDWFDDSADEVREEKRKRAQVDTEEEEDAKQGSTEESDEEMNYDAARRVSRLRGHWTSQSQYSFMSSLRHGMLMGSMGFGSDNDVQFVHDEDTGFDNDDDDNDDSGGDDDNDEDTNMSAAGRFHFLMGHPMNDDSDNDEEWNPGDESE
jgi:hypothetical protein